jgi:integrase
MAYATNEKISIGPFRSLRLEQNAGGYWEIRWSYYQGPGSFKGDRKSCRTKLISEAEVEFEDFCRAAREATEAVKAQQGLTVDELCRRWLENAALHGKERTGFYVLSAPRRMLGHYTAAQLVADDDILAAYPRQRGIANGSIRRELGALKTVLRWAAKKKLITAAEVPSFYEMLPPSGAPRAKFLTREQKARFWEEAMRWGDGTATRHWHPLQQRSAYRLMLFIALGLETAARRGAIYDLTWDRVDLERATIDYRVPEQRVTKKRRVRVPISTRLQPVLEAAWLKAPKDAGGRATGRVLGEDRVIDQGFVKFTTMIGMRWVTPHVLRHTWGSLAAINGVPLWHIAQVMGDTIATIEANYLHLTPEHLRGAVDHDMETIAKDA